MSSDSIPTERVEAVIAAGIGNWLCSYGDAYSYHLRTASWRTLLNEQQKDAEKAAAYILPKVIETLGLTEEWTDDIAGPEWARYSRLVTPTVTHHGPKYLGVPSAERSTE